ncbi:MAG: hypothetical protein AB7F76_06780, partial [Parvibaculaceae bacterium]
GTRIEPEGGTDVLGGDRGLHIHGLTFGYFALAGLLTLLRRQYGQIPAPQRQPKERGGPLRDRLS